MFKPKLGERTRVRILRVIDGDSLVARKPGFWAALFGQFEIRVWGMDAPEFKQDNGEASKKYMEGLARGNIRITVMDIDHYNRRVSVIERQGADKTLNHSMVEAGWAYFYGNYVNRAYHQADAQEIAQGMSRAEAGAKGRRLGIWADGGDEQRPWDYRRDERAAGSGGSLVADIIFFLLKGPWLLLKLVWWLLRPLPLPLRVAAIGGLLGAVAFGGVLYAQAAGWDIPGSRDILDLFEVSVLGL